MSSIAAEHPRPLRNFVMAGICLLTLASVAAMQPSTAQVPTQDAAVAASASMTPKLAQLAQSDPGRRVDVIVRLQPDASAEPLRSFVTTAGGHAGESIELINAFSARLRAGDAKRLASQPGVFAVSLNGNTKPQAAGLKPDGLATTFNQSVKTPETWKHATGKGIGVALIDTGVAGGLADFRKRNSSDSRIVASAVVNPDATTAGDKYGHGTHVAGLIAGDSSRRRAGDPLRGRYAGTAPGAHLVSIKASDDKGDATVLDVIYGIEFALEHKDEFNIRVLNLSLESTEPESYRTSPLAAAVEAAWFRGIVVVTAAGNRGTDADAVDYAPGNDPYVISVGAVDNQGTEQVEDDVPTHWSSRGTTQDGYAKPDVYAPGSRIYSNLAPNSEYTSICDECVTSDGQYIRAGGTSMSAPIVSGIVAALLEEHPTWTPDQVKGALVHNLQALPGGGQEVDAYGALTASKGELVSNRGLEPNKIVDPATGAVDWSKSRWSKSRWSKSRWSKSRWSKSRWSKSRWSKSRWSAARGELNPSWAGSSYVCDCELIDPDTGEAAPNKSRWSKSRWSKSRWSKSRWSKSRWSKSRWSKSRWSKSRWSKSRWSAHWSH